MVALVLLCSSGSAAGDGDGQAPDPTARQEWGVLPALGYDPDTGFDLGIFTHVAQLDPHVHPYRWRLRGQLQTSILARERVEFPRYENYVRYDRPAFLDSRSRLRLDLTWFRQLNAGYFGLGNRSPAGDPRILGDDYHEYRLEAVYGKAIVERQMGGPSWRVMTGVALARIDVDTYVGSLLARDVHRAAARGDVVPGEPIFTALVGQLGLVLDTRDHETFPTCGLYHDLVARAAPALGDGPAWGGVTYTARFYQPLVADRLVLAVRALSDVLFGEAPLSELARHGGLLDAVAFGGASGVRGITGGRFIGKTKAIASAEIRARLLPFRLFGEHMNLGAATFYDTGRVWTRSLAPDPELDGSGLGLRWGGGVGARLLWGESLLIRLDLAHSPNTDDFGGGTLATYLAADATF